MCVDANTSEVDLKLAAAGTTYLRRTVQSCQNVFDFGSAIATEIIIARHNLPPSKRDRFALW